MAGQQNPVTVEAVDKATNEELDHKKLSMESLSNLLIAHKLGHLKQTFGDKSKELHGRQEEVRTLHRLMKLLNKHVDKDTGELRLEGKKGEVNESLEELHKLLKEASANKKHGVEHKTAYTKDERERLMENLKLGVEDLNLQNDMQVQDLSQLINERYEAYQIARAIMKPLHDDKLQKARSVTGR